MLVNSPFRKNDPLKPWPWRLEADMEDAELSAHCCTRELERQDMLGMLVIVICDDLLLILLSVFFSCLFDFICWFGIHLYMYTCFLLFWCLELGKRPLTWLVDKSNGLHCVNQTCPLQITLKHNVFKIPISWIESPATTRLAPGCFVRHGKELQNSRVAERSWTDRTKRYWCIIHFIPVEGVKCETVGQAVEISYTFIYRIPSVTHIIHVIIWLSRIAIRYLGGELYAD